MGYSTAQTIFAWALPATAFQRDAARKQRCDMAVDTQAEKCQIESRERAGRKLEDHAQFLLVVLSSGLQIGRFRGEARGEAESRSLGKPRNDAATTFRSNPKGKVLASVVKRGLSCRSPSV